MKKNVALGLALISAMAFVSCKSSKDSSYKQAYEKAKAQEAVIQEQAAPVTVAPVQVQSTPVVQNKPVDTSDTRQEHLNVLNGGTLKAFNVVCGSFKNLDNANNLRNELVNKGYSAQVAQNPETGMYRVIASSFDDKAACIQSRDQLRSQYNGAWILYRTY